MNNHEKNIEISKKIANKLTPKLRRAFIEWLEELKKETSIENNFETIFLTAITSSFTDFISEAMYDPLSGANLTGKRRNVFMGMIKDEIIERFEKIDKNREGE